MNYALDTYNEWFQNNVTISNALSAESLRSLTFNLLMGRNYRLVTEVNTKGKLMLTYLWLIDVVKNAREEYGDAWQQALIQDLTHMRRRTSEQNNLLHWLIGSTIKTTKNLGLEVSELPVFAEGLIKHISDLFDSIGRTEDIEGAWLLMMAGSATLNIRGSEKSKIGKRLESAFIRACLSMLGLQENVDYWLNIQRDAEVDRETDAEVATQRGRIRIEMGLIASGNQEVIEDKAGRVGRNGVVLFDIVGDRTRVYDTAARHDVKLIQIRNNQPLLELYRHLQPLVACQLQHPPVLEDDIRLAVEALPDDLFLV